MAIEGTIIVAEGWAEMTAGRILGMEEVVRMCLEVFFQDR